MASFDSSTTALLASIRRRARSTNSAAPGFADSTLLNIANEVMLGVVVPEVASRRAHFFRKTKDTTLTAGTATYPFFHRTIGSVVENFFRVSAVDGSVHPLVEWQEEDLQERNPSQQGTPQAFVLRQSEIQLYPVPNTADTLRQIYLRRPNNLVLPSACMAITGISGGGLNVYAGTKPSTITTSTPCDIISAKAPFSSWSDDQTPSAVVASTSVTFTTAITGAAVGDYVCLAEEAPLVQLPPEFFAVVAQNAAVELLSPGRDRAALEAAKDVLAKLEERVYGLVVDRVQGQPEYLFGGDWPA